MNLMVSSTLKIIDGDIGYSLGVSAHERGEFSQKKVGDNEILSV